ncbi:Hypp5665 [Branchiostoma lanceolatum]|uniref:Hypp5665 protein n=1 Tax=Branchiostoma lanceolatum TaxID=7740 RepID=A0A8J9W3F8_BRALA|nr:Hypp5665 [Branchiostoma lanceolatum]
MRTAREMDTTPPSTRALDTTTSATREIGRTTLTTREMDTTTPTTREVDTIPHATREMDTTTPTTRVMDTTTPTTREMDTTTPTREMDTTTPTITALDTTRELDSTTPTMRDTTETTTVPRLNMENTVYFRWAGRPMLNMIVIVFLMIITTAQSQNSTMTEAASTAGVSTPAQTAAAVTTHAPTTAAAPAMPPVQKLVGSVTASGENGPRFTKIQDEMTVLLVDSFNNTNSELAPIFQRIEVESVSFTVNFRLVLSKNVNGSDVNGTAAAAVLLGSLSDSGMLGKFMVGNEGVYFFMPTIPEPTEAPFDLPYWGPVVALVSMVVIFLVLVIVAACYMRFKSDKTKLVNHEEEFDAEL